MTSPTRLLRKLWSRHRLSLIAFGVAFVAMLFFGIRLVVFTMWWGDPAHHFQSLEPWMTPRYVARSWNIEPEELLELWNLPEPGRRRYTLGEIMRENGQSLEALEALLPPRPANPDSASP